MFAGKINIREMNQYETSQALKNHCFTADVVIQYLIEHSVTITLSDTNHHRVA